MRAKTFVVAVLVVLSCMHSCTGWRQHSDRAHHQARKLVNNQRSKVLDVEHFGAKADNVSDNFQAFKKAWYEACNSLGSQKIVVPKDKTYYVKHINFTGPCSSPVFMEIQGTIRSFPLMSDIPGRLWIVFDNVQNIDIFGGGTIDGNGEVWWKNSCKIKKTEPCQTENAPAAVTFNNCSNLRVRDIKLMNAQQMHIHFLDCHDVEASRLSVTAPEDSPNTDGIHVNRTTNLDILHSQIRTGDDCISIGNGSRNVEVKDIMCGPGHGISIGSLGKDNTEDHVSDIHVKAVRLNGTTNGVRIKTWQGGRGIARNIEFEDIEMENVTNPIIINQYYCDKDMKCVKQESGVQVENITYRNIRGTSASRVAINFNCSESVPCRDLKLENVKLSGQQDGENVEAVCSQVALQSVKLDSVPSCPMQKLN